MIAQTPQKMSVNLNEFVEQLEPLLRRIIREELTELITDCPMSSILNQTHRSMRIWKKHFVVRKKGNFDSLPMKRYGGRNLEKQVDMGGIYRPCPPVFRKSLCVRRI